MSESSRHPRLTRLVAIMPTVTSLLVGACGVLVIAGWMRDSQVLKGVLPHAVPMNPATAICFILLAIAIWMLRHEGWRAGTWIVNTCGAIVTTVGMLRLVGYAFDGRARVDEMLFAAQLNGNVMAPNTATAFVLSGIALLAIDTHTPLRRLRMSQFFLFGVGCISALALLGYLYQVGALYSFKGFIPMALNTATCFAMLVVGALCARPARQPVATLLDDTVGGTVARRLLPAAFILPVVLGYLRLMGERRGWFSAGFGLTLFVLSLIVIFNALIWWNAQIQRRSDQRRRLTEDALRLSEERHRAVMEQAAEGITLVDAESLRIMEVNQAFARLLGYTQKELTGRAISEFIVDTPESIAARAHLTLDRPDAPTVTRRRYRRKDGSIVAVEKSATVIQFAGRRVLCTVVHDITERERAENELRESEERHRAVTEQLAEGIYLVDLETKQIIEANFALERLLGYERGETKGCKVYDFVHDTPEHVDARLLVLAEAPLPLSGERIYRRKDGTGVQVESTASVITFAGRKVACTVVHDITERKTLERELQDMMRAEHEAHEQLKQTQSVLVQTEKLAGLGQMVAGVAHEINNPLAFVSNNVAVLQRDIKTIAALLNLYGRLESATPEQAAEVKREIHDLAERIDLAYTLSNLDELLVRSRDGLKRIQQIVKDLREFARLDAGDLHETDLNAGIESTVNIVRGLAKKKQITLDLELGAIPQVACYPAKINQVVMNLVTNAIDATDDGGRVTVRSAPGANGDIRIEVADTGRGIPPEVRQRIFDPFFTTKPIGKGTGLGLSISYGIIRDHGGKIEVDSEVGKGTKFTITLPVQFSGAKSKEKEPQMNADERG